MINVIYGAGVVGEAIYYACRDKGITILCFCDDDTSRMGDMSCCLDILSIDDVLKAHENINFIIAIHEIKHIVPLIPDTCTTTDCVEFLEEFNIYDYTFSKPWDFVTEAINTCISCHKACKHPDKLFIRSVDFVITEKCSLRCADCSNLMQYYNSPCTYDTDFLCDSIDKLCDLVDEIHELRIIGGEPLIHKHHSIIVSKALSKKNINRVIIFTNGTITISDEKILAYKSDKVIFVITDYGDLSKQIDSLIKTLKDNDIAYYVSPVGGWTNCAKIVTHTNGFELFQKCCAKNLFTLLKHSLYRCPFAANAINLGLIDKNVLDCCDISTATKSSIKHMIEVTNKNGLNACDHCLGRSYGDEEIEPAIQNER